MNIRLFMGINSEHSSFPEKKKKNTPSTSFSEYDGAVANRKHIPLAQFLANNQSEIHGVFGIQKGISK